MKARFTLFLLFTILSFSAYAQPEGDTFPDFTVTDIDGDIHHLQSYLDDGKIVLIDVFATWCSVCIGSLPAIEELYEAYGPDGDNTLVVLSFEKDPNTSNEADFVDTYNVPNPVIADGLDEIDEWNTLYQPNFFVVCSDGSFEYYFGGIGSNTTILQGFIDTCEELSTGINTFEEELGLNFFSNPVKNELVFELKNETIFNYSIIGLSGKILLKGNSNVARNNIDVSQLENGIYLLQLDNGKDINLTRKFIKN